MELNKIAQLLEAQQSLIAQQSQSLFDLLAALQESMQSSIDQRLTQKQLSNQPTSKAFESSVNAYQNNQLSLNELIQSYGADIWSYGDSLDSLHIVLNPILFAQLINNNMMSLVEFFTKTDPAHPQFLFNNLIVNGSVVDLKKNNTKFDVDIDFQVFYDELEPSKTQIDEFIDFAVFSDQVFRSAEIDVCLAHMFPDAIARRVVERCINKMSEAANNNVKTSFSAELNLELSKLFDRFSTLSSHAYVRMLEFLPSLEQVFKARAKEFSEISDFGLKAILSESTYSKFLSCIEKNNSDHCSDSIHNIILPYFIKDFRYVLPSSLLFSNFLLDATFFSSLNLDEDQNFSKTEKLMEIKQDFFELLKKHYGAEFESKELLNVPYGDHLISMNIALLPFSNIPPIEKKLLWENICEFKNQICQFDQSSQNESLSNSYLAHCIDMLHTLSEFEPTEVSAEDLLNAVSSLKERVISKAKKSFSAL